MDEQRIIAVVSLGSNGFHLHSVSVGGGMIKSLGHLHEPVQIESWVDKQGMIDGTGERRTMDAIDKFAGYLQNHPQDSVAAIATGTFRRAGNGEAVLDRAGRRLGFPIKALTGMEESRLCYTGIASAEGFVDHNRLVIDVGGASTELMIARQNTLECYFSLDIGCVSLSNEIFTTENIDERQLDDALERIREVFEPVVGPLKEQGWEEAMGCGGTVSSLYTFLHRHRMAAIAITGSSLERFRTALLESGSSIELTRKELGDGRARLMPAGATLLTAAFNLLGIEKMKPVFSSVAQGMIVELARSRVRQG